MAESSRCDSESWFMTEVFWKKVRAPYQLNSGGASENASSKKKQKFY